MMKRINPKTLLLVLLITLPIAMVVSLLSGTVAIPLSSLWQAIAHLFSSQEPSMDSTILFTIRLPRILLVLCVGCILATSGAVMQGLFRNPLADPSLIGISSGASVGASIMIVLASSWLQSSSVAGLGLIAFGAFIGGFVATLVVYRLATSEMGTSVATMLLAGIAIGAIAGALNSLLSYFSDNDMLRQISLWQMGNFSTANWSRVIVVAAIAALLLIMYPRDSKALNALLLGESEARYLGIDVQRVKRRLILLTALGVGVAVAAAGLVAFVGLVVPHMIRLLIGPDHSRLIPASALAGALLLIVADGFARLLVSPAELPTGILTALLGAPFFVALLIQQRRSIG
jgi:iron complex transport system permease protein